MCKEGEEGWERGKERWWESGAMGRERGVEGGSQVKEGVGAGSKREER